MSYTRLLRYGYRALIYVLILAPIYVFRSALLSLGSVTREGLIVVVAICAATLLVRAAILYAMYFKAKSERIICMALDADTRPHIAVIAVVMSCVEEAIFRGVLLGPCGNVGQALIFAWGHGDRTLGGMPSNPLFAFVLGLGLGWLARYGLWAPITVHVFFNLVSFAFIAFIARRERGHEIAESAVDLTAIMSSDLNQCDCSVFTCACVEHTVGQPQ